MSRKFNMTVLTPEGLRAINDQIQQNPFDVAFDENAFQRYLSLANEALARFQDRQDLDIAKYIPSILFKGTPGRDNPLDFKNVSKTGNGIFYLTNIRSDLNRGLTPARLCGGSFSRFVKNINAQIGRDSQRVDANVGDSAVGWANALLTQLQKIFKPYIDIVGASNLADACVKFGSAKTYASLAEKQLVLPAGGKATLNSVVFADPEKKLRASQIYQSNPLKHRKGVSAAYLNIGKTKYPRTQGVFRNPRTGQIEVGSGCVTGQYVSDLALKGIRYKPKIRRPKFATKEEAGYYNQVSRQGLKKLIGKNKSIVRKYCKPMKDLSGFDPSMYQNAARSATLAMRSGMGEQLAQQLAKPQNLRNPRPLEALPSLSRMQARNEARPRYYQTTVGKTVKNGYYGKNGWVEKGTPTKVKQRNPNMAKPFKAGSAQGIQDFAAKLQQRDGASRAQWFAQNGVTVPGNKK